MSQVVPASAQNTAVSVPTIAQQVVDLVNQERAKEGLSPLTLDATLCQAASIRVNEISGQFSHTRPDGTTCFTALDEAGVNYSRAGENIALGTVYRRAGDAGLDEFSRPPGQYHER